MGLFDYMSMANTYEQRKVDNTTANEVEIDTCSVTDSTQPFETAICSKHYNSGNWIVVEQYDTKKDAQLGHDKWVKTFTESLPKSVEDVSTCEIMRVIDLFSDKARTFKKQE